MQITRKTNHIQLKIEPGFFRCLSRHSDSTLIVGNCYRVVKIKHAGDFYYQAYDEHGNQALYKTSDMKSRHLFAAYRFERVKETER